MSTTPMHEHQWYCPQQFEAIVTRLRDDHTAEVVIPSSMLPFPDQPKPHMTLNIPYLPHTPLTRGDRVTISVWNEGRGSFVTDIVGHHTEEQLDALLSINIECDKCGQLLAIPSTVTDNGDGGVTLSILNDPWPAMDEHRTTCPAEV